VNSLELVDLAMKERITVVPGSIFSATQRFQNFIRLSCGMSWSERAENALIRLGQIIARLAR
jgi:DNA-binding transcriptional MocR family regulator